jgi:signal transduction histidine kinase
MLADDLLRWITQGCFLLIAASTLVDLVRHRDRTRIDIALMFGALAAIVLIQGLTKVIRQQVPWLVLFGTILLLAQPYLLLRLVRHFRPVPRPIQFVALGGMIISWIILAAMPAPLPPPLALLIVAYFVSVEGYAAVTFARGAWQTGGVSHHRLSLAAIGSSMLAIVLLLAGLNIVLPAGIGITAPLSQLLALLCMLSYYFGFATPGWLRHAWQLSELQRFLHAATRRAADERVTTTLNQLCLTSTRAVGGMAAAVALCDTTGQRLTIRTSSAHPVLAGSLIASSGAIGRAWQERQPAVAHTPADFGLEATLLGAAPSAGALLVVPIATAERAWGIIMVFLNRGPLFATDDLNLLELLTEQSAMVLDNTALLEEQLALVTQLRQQTAQLAATNKELEAFSYSVSHDLRAPLRSIDGFSQALLEDYGDQLDTDGQDYLQRVRAATQRMAQLIDDLLSLARVTRSELHHDLVDLSAHAKTIANELQRTQPDRQVAFVIAPGLAAHGDERLLHLVLENLLANAWKFTGGCACPHIEFGAVPCDGQIAYFVRDNGAGFDMAYADKLFGAFQRLHALTEFAGTGIGLATVQRVIHRHGGRVWAESAVAQGATFFFSLQQKASHL